MNAARMAPAAMFLAIVLPVGARADLLTVSEAITTNVSLNGVNYANRLVTLTVTADTANVAFVQASDHTQYSAPALAAAITISGVGTVTLSDAFEARVQAYSTFSDLLLVDDATHADILDDYASAAGFAGVDLRHAFGPTSGGASYSTNALFATDGGAFGFTRAGGGSVSAAGAVSVPAPPSLALSGLGAIGIALGRLLGGRGRIVRGPDPVAVEGPTP